MNWKLILDLTAAYPSYGMEVQEVQAHELVFFWYCAPVLLVTILLFMAAEPSVDLVNVSVEAVEQVVRMNI